ncbi:MAG: hypothetical protein L3J65_12995, partial [Robiginitomaculum sp.]|nr:hypothetical protein [Robiginitomaculum sp.]
NSNRIASNVALINTNSGLIASNTDMILSNTAEIKNLTKGLAGVVALPTVFLDADKDSAIAGGIGFFGGEIGLGITGTKRVNNSWSVGASIAVSDDVATGRIQAQWSR